jgi:hypothetical protein
MGGASKASQSGLWYAARPMPGRDRCARLHQDHTAATPEIGRTTLEATFQSQPYLLPAEKYDAWKAVGLVFMAGGRLE